MPMWQWARSRPPGRDRTSRASSMPASNQAARPVRGAAEQARQATDRAASEVTALAAGREVVVSRGEMVEIGDGFRLPDLIASTGTRLREVGTAARKQIEAILGTPVYLDLHIKIAKDWQRDPRQLRKLGF